MDRACRLLLKQTFTHLRRVLQLWAWRAGVHSHFRRLSFRLISLHLHAPKPRSRSNAKFFADMSRRSTTNSFFSKRDSFSIIWRRSSETSSNIAEGEVLGDEAVEGAVFLKDEEEDEESEEEACLFMMPRHLARARVLQRFLLAWRRCFCAEHDMALPKIVWMLRFAARGRAQRALQSWRQHVCVQGLSVRALCLNHHASEKVRQREMMRLCWRDWKGFARVMRRALRQEMRSVGLSLTLCVRSWRVISRGKGTVRRVVRRGELGMLWIGVLALEMNRKLSLHLRQREAKLLQQRIEGSGCLCVLAWRAEARRFARVRRVLALVRVRREQERTLTVLQEWRSHAVGRRSEFARVRLFLVKMCGRLSNSSFSRWNGTSNSGRVLRVACLRLMRTTDRRRVGKCLGTLRAYAGRYRVLKTRFVMVAKSVDRQVSHGRSKGPRMLFPERQSSSAHSLCIWILA